MSESPADADSPQSQSLVARRHRRRELWNLKPTESQTTAFANVATPLASVPCQTYQRQLSLTISPRRDIIYISSSLGHSKLLLLPQILPFSLRSGFLAPLEFGNIQDQHPFRYQATLSSSFIFFHTLILGTLEKVRGSSSHPRYIRSTSAGSIGYSLSALTIIAIPGSPLLFGWTTAGALATLSWTDFGASNTFPYHQGRDPGKEVANQGREDRDCLSRL